MSGRNYEHIYQKCYSFLYARKKVKKYHIYLYFQQYSQLGNLSVGPVSYAEENEKFLPLITCKKSYKKGSVEPSEEAYDIDAELETGYMFFRKCEYLILIISYCLN